MPYARDSLSLHGVQNAEWRFFDPQSTGASVTTSKESLPIAAAIRPPSLAGQADVDAVKRWRKAMRQALLAERLAVADAQHVAWSAVIHHHLARAFRDIDGITIGFYWPHQREFDARPLMGDLLANGAICALPVVAVPKCPLLFREWRADTPLDTGLYGIPIPVGTREVVPDVVFAPVNGFDPLGYRLGYGSGYFDRTLAALGNRPTSIGIGFDLARLESIYPQPHDVPLDFIVTESGICRTPAGGCRMDGSSKESRHFVPERVRQPGRTSRWP
jgi:5-formyltetrahydrofolate cyclo-ligase